MAFDLTNMFLWLTLLIKSMLDLIERGQNTVVLPYTCQYGLIQVICIVRIRTDVISRHLEEEYVQYNHKNISISQKIEI